MIAYVGIDAHTTNYTLSTYLEGSAAPVNTNACSVRFFRKANPVLPA